jgi:pyrroloquinoline quinone biosynthesis protein D
MAEPDVMRARPRLLPGVRLVQSESDGWVLLGPERGYKADAMAAEIIKRCTGEATLAEIIDDLASRQTMARGKIALDVLSVVEKLHGQMLLELD